MSLITRGLTGYVITGGMGINLLYYMVGGVSNIILNTVTIGYLSLDVKMSETRSINSVTATIKQLTVTTTSSTSFNITTVATHTMNALTSTIRRLTRL